MRGMVVVGACMAALAAPAAAQAQHCSKVYVGVRGVPAKVQVVSGSASCSGARRLIRSAFTAETNRHWNGSNDSGVFWRVNGWNCTIGLGGSETFCSRGNREIDGSFRRDDGWSF